METQQDFAIGLVKINKEYRLLKGDLENVAKTENMIENLTYQYGVNFTANTFEEYEILVQSEISEFNKSKKSLLFLKVMLILFESFSGYLAIGLIAHMMNFDSFASDNMEWLPFLIKWVLAGLFAAGFIHLAMAQVKKYPWVAFFLLLIMPMVNLYIVYGMGVKIDNKETYLISSFITFSAGACLLYIAHKEFQKEHKLGILKQINDKLKDRNSYLKSSENHYLKIFSLNNEENSFLDELKNIPESNPLYKELRRFLDECEDFDQWSIKQIREIKAILKQRGFQTQTN